jgi:hypothetical protein
MVLYGLRGEDRAESRKSVEAVITGEYDGNQEFRRLIQWALQRKKNAWVTSLDVFERELGLSRGTSVKLGRRLEELGLATFVEGRRGWKSRVRWAEGLWRLVDIVTAPEA